MFWIIFAFLAAFFNALTNIFSKDVLNKENEYTVLWGRNFFSIPLLILALFLVGLPSIEFKFWLIILAMMPLEIILAILFFKALKISPISLVIPFTTFTPLFLGVSSFFILQEKLSLSGIVGVILVVSGAYFMNIKGETKNILEPIKNLLKEKGILMIIIVSLIWAITVPFGKIAIQYSSPIFFSAVYFSIFTALFFPIFIKKVPRGFQKIKLNNKKFILIGITNGLMIIFSWLAISQGFVAYVKSIGMFSILLTIIFAGSYLKEKHTKERLAGSLLMIIGTIFIILSQ